MSAAALARLEQAAHSCRRHLAAVESPDASNVRWLEGVLIKDSEELLDAAESFTGHFGELDEGPAVDMFTAGLLPADIPTAIQHVAHATRACRRNLGACAITKDAGALRKADSAYIATVKTLLTAADNTIRLVKMPKPKPAPAPAPKAAPIDNTKLVDSVFKAVTEFVTGELTKQAGQEREAVERLIRDSLGDLKDSIRTKEDLRELRELQAKGETDRRIADLGKSLSKMLDRRIEQTKAEAAKEAARHASAKANEIRKQVLATIQVHSDEVQVVGWTPRHEWRGTEIRFELAPGSWGPWTDVQGDRGRDGISGGGAVNTKRLEMDGGGAFDEFTTLDGETAGANIAALPGIGGGGADTVFASATFNGGRAI